MTSTLVSLLILLLFIIFLASASRTRLQDTISSDNGLILQACKASRDPPECAASLTQSKHAPPPNGTILEVIESAVWASLEKLDVAIDMMSALHNSSAGAGNQNLTMAVTGCLKGLINDKHRAGPTFDALRSGRMKDARAWTSTAGATQLGCSDGLAKATTDSKTNETAAFVGRLGGLTRNALGMMVNYDNFGAEYEAWGPVRTERDGFWERLDSESGFDFHGGVPRGLTVNVTVCKDGCDYLAVQEAVDVAPEEGGGRFVIWIKAGIYEEVVGVPFSKKNVVFLGDGMGKTVITASLYVGMPGVSTLYSATVAVEGDGFMCSNLTIENTAGPAAHQAVAFRSDSDLSVMENCEFIGHQDTLYVHSLRQYYKLCRIQGNVDFIFGNAAAFFQDCIILIAPRQANVSAGATDTVTAQGRTDPAQSTGLVFYNCLVNGTEEYVRLQKSQPKLHKGYLGRPWKEFSRTVFINSTLECVISPQGWMPWAGDSALATLYYGEFSNAGPGANLSARIPWSSHIPQQHVHAYTLSNFIQGGHWIPTI